MVKEHAHYMIMARHLMMVHHFIMVGLLVTRAGAADLRNIKVSSGNVSKVYECKIGVSAKPRGERRERESGERGEVRCMGS